MFPCEQEGAGPLGGELPGGGVIEQEETEPRGDEEAGGEAGEEEERKTLDPGGLRFENFCSKWCKLAMQKKYIFGKF